MNKSYDDSNWREEYKSYTTNKRYLELLENGPKSLSQAWLLGALHNEWKKMKGYDKFDPDENEGQLQSSLSEWEESIKKYNIGSCKICNETNTKVCNDICRNCEKGLKGFRYNVDTLKNAMLYLDEHNK